MTIQIPYEAMPKMTPDISKDFSIGAYFHLKNMPTNFGTKIVSVSL